MKQWALLSFLGISIGIMFVFVLRQHNVIHTISKAASITNQKSATPFSVSNVSINFIQTLSPDDVMTAQKAFLNTTIETKTQLQEYTLSYTIEREGKNPVPATAVMYVPVTTSQAPVLVYGAGTTGLADRCAPSLEDQKTGSLGGYRNHIITQASQGTIVIMPNYLGFDTSEQLQHYFIAEEEAYSLLSSATAFFSSQKPSDFRTQYTDKEIFLAGYSQGGHAAFAAADYASSIAPDLQVKGVIGHGPTTNIVNVLQANPNLAPYMLTAYASYYSDFDPTRVISNAKVEDLRLATDTCADEGFGYNSTTVDQMFTTQFKTFLTTSEDNATIQKEIKYFQNNDAGTHFSNIPVFIAQGTTDPIVTSDQQQAFKNSLCQRNVSVTFKEYPDQHHFYIRQVSFEDTQNWIKNTLTNATKNNC